jgi:hypothetical protein
MKQNISEVDLRDLTLAKSRLEYLPFAAKATNMIGKPVEEFYKLLPSKWKDIVGKVTKASLYKGLSYAILTLGNNKVQKSKERFHRLLVTATGVGGGAFGFSSMLVELPISTCLMLRSIADIARSEGHDITKLDVRLSCLEVFAFGGRNNQDDPGESGYWITRAALARTIAEASTYIAEKGLMEEGAPVLVRLITKIAERFGAEVSTEIAAKAVPVVGALSGALINLSFMDHFQNIARGHFIVKRLENTYGSGYVQKKYDEIAI